MDTHVFRVTKRLGWIPPNTTYEKAHQLLAAPTSPRIYYRLHLNVIRHGREICVAGVPRCERCPLTEVCEYYQKIRSAGPNKALFHWRLANKSFFELCLNLGLTLR